MLRSDTLVFLEGWKEDPRGSLIGRNLNFESSVRFFRHWLPFCPIATRMVSRKCHLLLSGYSGV